VRLSNVGKPALIFERTYWYVMRLLRTRVHAQTHIALTAKTNEIHIRFITVRVAYVAMINEFYVLLVLSYLDSQNLQEQHKITSAYLLQRNF
jgi:hypothetical protein